MSIWIAVGESSASAAASISVAQFIDRLAATRGQVVPVVGAGLALEAGAPGGSDLVGALLAADANLPDGPTTFTGSKRAVGRQQNAVVEGN